MIDSMYDGWMWGKERVSLNFFEGKSNRFAAKWATDLLEGIEG